MIEHKGLDPIPVDNYVHLLMTSNEDWVVPASSDERRFAVLDVGQAAMQNHGYFAEMLAEMDGGGRQALLADLLAYDLNGPDAPNLRQIPQTKALLEQKLQTLDAVTAWWYGRLETGAPTHRFTSWPSQPIPFRSLYDDFVATSEKSGIHRKPDEPRFAKKFRELVPGMKRTRRHIALNTDDDTLTGETIGRVWCYELLSLDECRQAFEQMLHQPIEWAVSDEEDDEAEQDLDPDMNAEDF